jgi:hypothetical protein
MRAILMTTVLATTMSLGLAASVADSQCSSIIPVPATAGDIACVTSSHDPSRCATPIPVTTCLTLTEIAFNDGLVTADGHDWLLAFGWCPIVADFGTGPRIIEFCPLH